MKPLDLKNTPGKFRIQNTATESVIHIEGAIGGDGWWSDGYTASKLRRDLADSKASTVRVKINSPGGEVDTGISIYNELKSSGKKIITETTGWAASIASVIFLAGSERIVATGAQVMIHNPWTFAAGEAKDMRKAADQLDKARASILEVYREVTGLADDALGPLMDAETWFTGAEAVANKFATEAGSSAFACYACASPEVLACFSNLPDSIKASGHTQNTMKPEIAALLGKPADTSDKKIVASVSDLKTSLTSANAALVTKTSEVASLTEKLNAANAKNEAAELAVRTGEADKFVAEAIAAGSLDESTKDKWHAAFLKDSEGTKAMLPKPRENEGHTKNLACGGTATGTPVATGVDKLWDAYKNATDSVKKHAAFVAWEKASK